MALTLDAQASKTQAAFPDHHEASWVAAEAPGKINLTLEVLGRRADGFHELRSLAVGVRLLDHVRCRVESGSRVSLRCSDATLESDENLAVRAVRALCRECARTEGLQIDLVKSIPVGAGMGGGSSDAASALRLANHLLSTGLDRPTLAKIGATLGSDVPLFFHLPAAVIAGRGERVEPVSLKWSGWVLLAFPGPAVPTADVYRAWRPLDAVPGRDHQHAHACEAVTADELAAMLYNDLEPAVFRTTPAVRSAFEALQRLGCDGVRVSGAGSALYQLFDEEETAKQMSEKIEGCGLGIKTRVVAGPEGERPLLTHLRNSAPADHGETDRSAR